MKMKIKHLFILMLLFFLIHAALAATTEVYDQSLDSQAKSAKDESAVKIPDLAEIIPLASELTSRLAGLEKKISGLLDVSAVEKRYDEIETNLKAPRNQSLRFQCSVLK